MPMTTPDFPGLLRRAIGLDAASIGASAVEIAVGARLTAHGINDLQLYWELVHNSDAELQALIETVVVPETWFFRDHEAFAALARQAAREWLPAHPDRTLRLLSLPCSSGEEPYSMAMALLDAGCPAQRYRIDAIDVSAQAVAHAQHGVYGRNSFRGTRLAFRIRHFAPTSDGYRINDNLREPVFFRQGNLFAGDIQAGIALYDAIFCRNLLIYFDREMQDQALRILRRLLKPDGILFVGPSEGALPLRHDFDPVRVPFTFAFRHRSVTAQTDRPVRAEPASGAPRATLSTPAAASTTWPRTGIAPADSTASGTALENAFRLADHGHLSAAARICEEFLRQHGPSVQAFHLLGLIASADDDLETAARHYRKALYVDQGHYATLVHLSLLLEKVGDVAGVRILRNRIRRLQSASCVT